MTKEKKKYVHRKKREAANLWDAEAVRRIWGALEEKYGAERAERVEARAALDEDKRLRGRANNERMEGAIHAIIRRSMGGK